MADFRDFPAVKLLGNRSFGSDDRACECDALAAARTPAERGIGGKRVAMPVACGFPHLALANRVAVADDHEADLGLLRVIRNTPFRPPPVRRVSCVHAHAANPMGVVPDS